MIHEGAVVTVGLYAKAVTGAVVAGLTSALAALDDGTVTPPEWAGIIATVLVAAGAVWAVPNLNAGVARYGKAITGGLVAGLGAAGVALTDGAITAAEWVIIALAVLGDGGLTWTVPNRDWSLGQGPTP